MRIKTQTKSGGSMKSVKSEKKSEKKIDALDILNAIITENIRKSRAQENRIDHLMSHLIPVALTLLAKSAGVSPSSASDAVLIHFHDAFRAMTPERLTSLIASGLLTEPEVHAFIATVMASPHASVKNGEPKKPDGPDETMQ